MQRKKSNGEPTMNHQGNPYEIADGMRALLRREVAAERPAFSDTFHTQLLLRLSPDRPQRACVDRPPVGRHTNPWGFAGPVAASAAVAAAILVAIMLTHRPSRDDAPLLAATPVTPGLASQAAGDRAAPAELVDYGPTAEEVVGLERMPMYDDIDEGLREGVSTLARSLLDVPEWGTLAEFDTAGFLDASGGP